MKIDIQLFASWDDLINTYNNNKANAENELNSLDSQKQQELDSYNQNYNDQLSQYEDLMNQQQGYIDTWAEEQKKQQQAQTDYNIGIINQNKEQAAKDTEAEIKDSYVDYMKQNNQYGGALETLASNGLATSGFAESSKIAMYNTYQNRVGTAKAALVKANTQYDNQIQQALLTNDASLAEIALEQMKQSYQIALQGFEYKQTMYNNKLNYETNLNEIYYNRKSDLQSRIDNYNNQLANINSIQEELAEKKAQREQEYNQWLAEFQEEQRQFNEELAETKRQYNQSYNATYNSPYIDTSVTYEDTTSNPSGKTSVKTADDQYTYAKTMYGNDVSTVNKKDYYFDNGYQPQYINNVKLGKTGVKVKEVFGTALGSKVADQNIWGANGKYYYWDGSTKDYVEIDGEALKKFKNAVGFFDKIFHKSV